MRIRLLAILLVATTAPAFADDGLLGRWEGTYACSNQRDSKMILTIDRVAGGKLSGVFEFKIRKAHGSYAVAGTVDGAGAFRLDPGKWIKRSSGYAGFAMTGQLAPEGLTIEGKIPACPHGGFSAAKAGNDSEPRNPDAQLAEQPEVAPPPKAAPPRKSDRSSTDHAAWAAALRADIAELVERAEIEQQAWRNIKDRVGLHT